MSVPEIFADFATGHAIVGPVQVKQSGDAVVIRILRVFGVLVCGFLAACEEGPNVIVEGQTGGPVWPYFVDAIKDKGRVLVEIHGDPFDEGTDAVISNVIQSMSQTMGDRTVSFSTDISDVTSTEIRIILMLGTPKNFSRRGLCESHDITDEGLAGPESDGKFRTLGLLCINGDRRMQVRAWVNDVTSSTDPKFALLVQQTAREMMTDKK